MQKHHLKVTGAKDKCYINKIKSCWARRKTSLDKYQLNQTFEIFLANKSNDNLSAKKNLSYEILSKNKNWCKVKWMVFICYWYILWQPWFLQTQHASLTRPARSVEQTSGFHEKKWSIVCCTVPSAPPQQQYVRTHRSQMSS